MHLLEMLGQRKRTATEPPFTGQVTELDGSPADLSSGVTNLKFRLGTPGQTPIIDQTATFTNAALGEWEYVLTTLQAAALTPGIVLVHVVITYDSGLVEPVPFDHYFELEILEML
ncbi:hypothetical protein LCGC14_1848400 [marine sediment metagenome]|uniref:BppU N-terminal domain-containing protein n=1 Tax=marine sediment metagenome TaxID=412755 RepID=A0A0F9IQN4_9ZZZZ